MKKLVLILMIVPLSMALIAQPVLNSSFNPEPGDIYKYHPVNTLITPGNAGANVTWDFSNIHVIYNPTSNKYTNPTITPYDTSFPSSNIALEDVWAAGTYYYFTTSASKIEKIGYANVMLIAKYNDVQTLYTYPFTFNTSVVDSFSCNALAGSLELKKIGLWQAKGDAYGTLRLPSGNFNTLRIETKCNTVDDYGTGYGSQGKNITEYLWVTETSKVPLLVIGVEYHFSNESPTDTIAYIRISDEVSGISDYEGGITNVKVYPNPAVDIVNLDYTLIKPQCFSLSIHSVEGKQIRTLTKNEYAVGQHTEKIDVGDLPKGVYTLRFETDGLVKQQKFIKL